jgi:hypothetical protein
VLTRTGIKRGKNTSQSEVKKGEGKHQVLISANLKLEKERERTRY